MHAQPTAGPASACLAEDDVLALARGGALVGVPGAEAHLADCAACSALLATLLRDVAPASARGSLAGTHLGPYRLDALVGAGGMGTVYRGWDPRLGRALAIKVLHGGPRDGVEARATAAIAHPSVVAVHDAGVADGLAYIAMELVDGESLRSVIARGPLPIARVRELGLELADGLAAAHARGVIHRDLKPENLIVTREGRLKILDFGLAKLAGALDETEPGTVQGTAGYLPPEQARGEAADARADLFAAGAILYELATGRRAFDGASHADRLSAVLRDEPPLAALGELAPIVGRCLAKDPRDRFQSAADLAWALGAAPPTQPAPPRRPSRRAFVIGASTTALAAAGGFVLGRRTTRTAPPARPAFAQLTYRTGRVATARFTGDGQRVVFGAAWDADPVRAFALELAGRGDRALALPAANVLAVSPRGELAVSLGHRHTNNQSATGELAIVPLAGGAPRTLAPVVQDADFAPDGTLAIVRPYAGGFQLELPIGTPLVASTGWLTHPRVSPDGQHVAYLQHPHANDDAGDVTIVELATRRVRTLARGWSSVAGLAWAGPRALWFGAARTGAQNELRSVTLDGATRTIAQTTGRLRLHDRAADGRALVSVDVWRSRTFVGAAGEERDRSLSDMSVVVDLSADGTQLAIGELGEVEAASGAYLVPVLDGPPLRLGPGLPVAISPSGARVAAAVIAGDRVKLTVYETTTATQREIAVPGPIGAARWIDETTLVGRSRRRMWRLALDARPVALTPPGVGGIPVLDPRRTRCAFVDPAGALHVLDLARGDLARVPGDFAREVACGWLAEPDAIVLRTPTSPVALTRVDPRTGARMPLLAITPPSLGLRAVDAVVLRSDASLYAYSFGQQLSQLYLVTLTT